MPNFRLQYDLRRTHVDNHIAGVSHQQVYNLICRILRHHNWTPHQKSNWYKNGTTLAVALANANAVCAAVEALCGLPVRPPPPNHIFIRVEVQRQTANTVVRP